MQDTSFAILPNNKIKMVEKNDKSIGSIISFRLVEEKTLEIQCENGYVSINFYRDDIVRIIMNTKTMPIKKSSFAVIKEPEECKINISDTDEQIIISSNKLFLNIKKKALKISIFDEYNRLIVDEAQNSMKVMENKELLCYKKMDKEDHYYGFGEKTSFLDKRGEKMTMWNSDVYAPHNPEVDALYQSIPFFMTICKGNAYGIFLDNTSKTVFDMKTSSEFYSFSVEAGQLDYFVFAGPSPKDVLEQYTTITGKMPLPPKWALGYHQSRYSYETEREVREIVANFKEKALPLDAIHLDIHYMQGYRVFTFNEDRFPNPKKLIKDLMDDGIHIVPIVDPGVKEDPEYEIYQEGIQEDKFCKYIEGEVYYGDVWPGNSAFPDFTNNDVRKWWGDKHEFYTDIGIKGIWIDMNEPAVFNESKTMDTKVMHENDGDPKTHRELHNVYGFLMGEATYEGLKRQLNGERPFLLTRSGYAGVQRYAAVWTGDNRSFWEHLQMALPMCMNLGISGVPFCGPDVGGFAHDSNGQLLTRWMQFGTFTPYFRNHSVLDSVRQEPWSFGEEYEKIIKKYIQERYVWLPYLYTLFHESSVTGVPIMRPLVFEFPKDENTFNLSDQFMIGADVIVAPILTPDTYHRVVYLPEGKWVNYWTDEIMEGHQHILVPAPLDSIPIFIKQGSIRIESSKRMSTKEEQDKLFIHVYPQKDKEIKFTFYDDDGISFNYEKGEVLEEKIICLATDHEIRIDFETKKLYYTPPYKKVIVIHNFIVKMDVVVNGQRITENKENYNELKKILIVEL